MEIGKELFSDSCSAVLVREFHYLHLTSYELISDRMGSCEIIQLPRKDVISCQGSSDAGAESPLSISVFID